MPDKITHAPTPWTWRDVAGAGLEIFAPVHLVEAVELPNGIPPININIGGMAAPQNVLIAYERWVQFEPTGWSDMQTENVKFIVKAVNSHDRQLEALKEAKKFIEGLSLGLRDKILATAMLMQINDAIKLAETEPEEDR